MNNGRWVIILAVSLYVLFFSIAFWSALTASFTGSTGGLAGIVGEPFVACELGTDSTAGIKGLYVQDKENGEKGGRISNQVPRTEEEPRP
ncbi:MAG: hypothetical protein ACLP5H_19295 [Desulfomonilaceae bacterium]